MGIVALISAVSLSFVALVYQAPWWSRAIVFVPLWFAGIGLLSARSHGRALIMAAAITVILIAL
jgi:hypothetical protein